MGYTTLAPSPYYFYAVVIGVTLDLLRTCYICIYVCSVLNCAGLISEHKHPIVTMQFLNEWGDRQVVPYRLAQNSSVRVDGKNTPTLYIYTYVYVHLAH